MEENLLAMELVKIDLCRFVHYVSWQYRMQKGDRSREYAYLELP